VVCAIYLVRNSKSTAKHLEARVALDGAVVLVARSGTACRAPTVGKSETEKNASATEASTAIALRFGFWHRQNCLCY
jgi:hypothetical protein